MILPPSGVYLAALVSRLTRICSTRTGSTYSGIGSLGQVEHQLVVAAFDERLGRGHGAVDHRGSVDRLALELNLVLRDPRDVEQIVDQVRQARSLAGRSPRRPGSPCRRSIFSSSLA